MAENAFIVQGGVPLKGTVTLEGAKNIGLKVVVAALLFNQPITLRNIPNIKDIRELFELLKSVGVEFTFIDNKATINPSTLKSHEVSLLYGSKFRASFLLFAPFLKRFGKAYIPNPGGCRIGARPIDRIVKVMDAFGVQTEYNSETGFYTSYLSQGKLLPASYTFKKKTHTGTELALMLAAVTVGHSVIGNASLEPEIDDLIDLLNQGGAKIKRVGESIEIDGVDELKPVDSFHISYDRNNAVTYAIGALATKGDVFVQGAQEKDLKVFLSCLDKIGAKYEIKENGIRFYYESPLQAIDVTTTPDPGFMTDWQAPWAVLMTQAEGESTIHETVFENRFGYAAELNKLGAHIEFFKPTVKNPQELYQFDIENPATFDNSQQAIRIHGPSELHGGALQVTDMRAGATLIIGACAAKGESIVNGASETDRGYEDIEGKLSALGARIKRV